MRGRITIALGGASIAALLMCSPALAQQGGIISWQDDLSPLANTDWNYDRAAHLLERAGFGGTPADIDLLASMSPSEAVRSLVYFDPTANSRLHPFDHSGIHDPGLEPFPPSRPSTTD